MVDSENQRVVMIGLDSADVDYVQAHLHALPRLRQLINQGQFHRLQTPGSIMSASVWPTFYTGKDPGEHGFYYPMQFHQESMRLRRVSAKWLYCEPFWNALSSQGIPITAFDVQTHFPGGLPLGVEITNWGGQSFSKPGTNRPDILWKIYRRFGKHPMRHDIPQTKTRSQRNALKRAVISGIDSKKEISLWLMRQTDWRLFITVFAECHRAGHYLWPTGGESDSMDKDLLHVFQVLDKAVGEILDRIDLKTTTVIVFAVHGMGPNYTQMHFLPQIMDRVNATFACQVSSGADARRTMPRRNVMRVLRESLSPTVQTKIAEFAPESVRDWVVSRQFGASHDWATTPGLAMPSGSEGFIRFNVKGRERNGILVPGSQEFHAYRDWVEKCFRSLRVKKTDEKVVEQIHYVPETYSGARVCRLPDLAVTWREIPPANCLVSDILGTIEAKLQTGRSGNHRPDGFAIVGGRIPDRTGDLPLKSTKDLSTFVSGAFAQAEQGCLSS